MIGDGNESKSPFQLPFRLQPEVPEQEGFISGLTNKKSNISRLITENIIIEDEPENVLNVTAQIITHHTNATSINKINTGWDSVSGSKLNMNSNSKKPIGTQMSNGQLIKNTENSQLNEMKKQH